METWIIVTIVIVILSSLGAAGGLTWFFIKKRSQRRANDAYTKSLINEALLAENLEKQQKAVNDLQTMVDTSNARTDEEQQALMLQLAESQKELEQLKNNITVAVKATNSLSHVKNATDNKGIADAARDATAAELKAVEDRNKAANQTIVDALNFTTLELDKQAAELGAFKASLKSDAMKLASEVGNPSIAPPMLPDATKPSIRTIWDAAINKVATADDKDLAIKQLSELYRIVGADADELVDAAEQMNEAPVVCERIYRAPFGGICPVGWTELRDQCYRGPCDNSPAPAPKPPTPQPPTPQPPTPQPPAPKPPAPKPPAPKPPAPKPPAPKPPAPKPPAPKPPAPRPPTALERKYPYWGWGANAGLRCTRNDNTGCNTGYDAKGQLVDLNPDRPPAPAPSQNNPQGIPDQVMKTLGLDVEQVTNILNLINGPEQSQSRWWERVNKQNVYSYCENIRDKRGVTVGLTGFVTAYDGPQEIIRNAGGPSFARGRYGTDSYPDERALCNWVRDNANNKRFHDAQWDYYLKMYIKPMMNDMRKYVPAGIRDEPLIIAAALDATINQGGGICGNCSGDFMKNARGGDRANWLNSFLNLRNAKFTAGNTAKMREGRLGAFRKLAVDGKWDMRNVDPCKYNYCSGRCVHC
jgi:type II secretory pathway pseudopilin PulG